MKILILGGTGWLGGLVAVLAADAGHTVTSLSRHPAPEPRASVTYVHADRNVAAALGGLATQAWDAIVDVSDEPGHVRRSARALAARAGTRTPQYVYISSCSVYPDHSTAGSDESAPTEDPLAADTWTDMEAYGAAKVACEQAVLAEFGPDATTIIRPGLIGGPGDTSNRSTYWPWRFAHPARPDIGVLVPDIPELVTAVLDVRDLAAWTLRLIETRTPGIFNALGAPLPLAEHLALAREVTGSRAAVVPVTQDWLLDYGVNPWAGPRSLPLWIPMPAYAGFNTRSTAAAQAAGLTWRPLAETIREAGQWWAERVAADPGVTARSGLSDAEEEDLLNRASESNPAEGGNLPH